MFLTRSTFNNIKRLFSSSLDEAARTSFSKLTSAGQMAQLRTITPAEVACDAELAGFVLVFNTKSNLVKAGSPEHYALRKALGLADPLPWHKVRPPKNNWEMQDSNRVPSWLEESQQMAAIARVVTWDDLRAGPEVLAAVVRGFYKIGGMEDLGDARAVQATDPTMKLFIEGVCYNLALPTGRPEWHDADGNPLKGLPEGTETRSQNEIENERERTEKLRRNEEARERTRVRREKELAEYGELRSKVLQNFRTEQTAVLAHTIASAEFETIKDEHEATITTQLQSTVAQIFELISVTITLPEGASADEVKVLREETLVRATDLAIQLVLDDVNEKQPGWLRRLSNGDFKFRTQPLKGDVRPPGYVSKYEKAAARAISKIYLAYGEEVLNFALQTIVGQKLTGPAQILKAPDWLKSKGGNEEIVITDDDAAQTGPAAVPPGNIPPPPPPPPVAPNLLG